MIQRIFTDGACTADKCGGWAAIFYTHNGTIIYGGGSSDTTNNRMELKAIIEALKVILEHDELYFERNQKYQNVTYEIYSDSAYCVNCINNRWYDQWENNHWKNAKGNDIKNPDMWDECKRLVEYLQESAIPVRVYKVKGHSGNAQNDLADLVAKSESLKIKIEMG